MSEREKDNLIISLRNQILATCITACIAFVGMSAMFMATINNTVKNLQATQSDMKSKQDKSEEKLQNLEIVVYSKK